MKRRTNAMVRYPSLPQVLELRRGPLLPGNSAFSSDDERELAWHAHGQRVLECVDPDKRSTTWALLQYGKPD